MGHPLGHILLFNYFIRRNNMKIKKEELTGLTCFPDRAKFIYEIRWSGSKRGFCKRYGIPKSTFYRVFGNKQSSYTDYVIECFARALSVSYDFLKNGGTTPGYYKVQGYIPASVRETPILYGKKKPGENKIKTGAVSGSVVELTMNDEEEQLEILMKVKYKDL